MKTRQLITSSIATLLTCAILWAIFSTNATANDKITRTINGVEYVQTFSDEFEGTTLDNSKWELCPEWDRQGLSKWQNDKTSLDGNGNLILTADLNESKTKVNCGAVRTKKRFYQLYGYFEIRVRLQTCGGFWSAFWMMPDNIDSKGLDGGSDGTEIDIYEAYSYKDKGINHAVHWDGYGSRHRSISKGVNIDVYDGQYHTFALDWSKEGYVFYIDGNKTKEITKDEVDVSTIENYMKISLECGAWTGLPKVEDMPNNIAVDYVKAYQRVEKEETTTTQITTTTTTFPTTTKQKPVYGDVNQDGKVNTLDVLNVRQYLVKKKNNISRINSDINSDNLINAKDVLLLRKHLAGQSAKPWA